jgi:hypothetical protein
VLEHCVRRMIVDTAGTLTTLLSIAGLDIMNPAELEKLVQPEFSTPVDSEQLLEGILVNQRPELSLNFRTVLPDISDHSCSSSFLTYRFRSTVTVPSAPISQ